MQYIFTVNFGTLSSVQQRTAYPVKVYCLSGEGVLPIRGRCTAYPVKVYCLSGEGVLVNAPVEVHAEEARLLTSEGAGAGSQDLDRLRLLCFSQSQKLLFR